MPQWIINMMMTWLHFLVGVGILFMAFIASKWVIRWIWDIQRQIGLEQKLRTKFDGGQS